MPLDGLMLSRIADELQKTLSGGRVDKVTQPERDEILLLIRAGGQNHRLLLSCSANHARAHLTQTNKKSMDPPPQLCMLLRKHLLGGRILAVSQVGMDRILNIQVESMDELGDYSTKTLTVEIMGRHSNLILVGADGRIIDSARRVTAEISRVREVLPHLPYQLPPAQEKLDARFADEAQIVQALSKGAAQTLDKAILGALSGVSTQAARELSYRFMMDEKAPPEVWTRHLAPIAHDLKRFFETLPEQAAAVLFSQNGQVGDVTAFLYQSRPREEQEIVPTMSQALDAFYAQRDRHERIRQKSAATLHTLQTALERCEKKLSMQLEKQQEVAGREQLRIYGELIMASVYAIPKGAKTASVVNYYEPQMAQIQIPLDETMSAAQNAQRYFKRYAKAKAAAELLVGQIAQNEAEIRYLQGQLVNLENITEENELLEIRQELAAQGYIRREQTKNGRPQKIPPTRPERFVAPDGTEIFVGKNNVQNDHLTFSAMPEDIWLHTQNIPGSHVIIRMSGAEQWPADETLLYAARIAARYSKARHSSQVPVDYTHRRYVKKPSGAKPGFVHYTHQFTVYVEPLS